MLSDRYMTMSELKDGLVRGGDFDRRIEAVVRQRLKKVNPQELEKKCLALGGTMIKSNADLCAAFAFFPRYPVTLKIWFEDEEFPASGKILLNASADHYLPIEDAVTGGQVIMEELLGVF